MSDENLNFPSEGNFPSKDHYPGVSPFERIKQMNPYGIEYWSARDLMPLLGYKKETIPIREQTRRLQDFLCSINQ